MCYPADEVLFFCLVTFLIGMVTGFILLDLVQDVIGKEARNE